MNTENSKTNESNKFISYFTDKLNLKKANENIALVNLSIYYTCKNINSETIADISPIHIQINKIRNRVVFKIKTGCKLELLSRETMKLLRSTKNDVDQDKNTENLPKLEIVHVILLHCNVVNNNHQQASKVLFTFVPNKQFGQLITIVPQILTMLKTTIAEFSFIEVWFTDQNNRLLKIEDNVNISLIITRG